MRNRRNTKKSSEIQHFKYNTTFHFKNRSLKIKYLSEPQDPKKSRDTKGVEKI